VADPVASPSPYGSGIISRLKVQMGSARTGYQAGAEDVKACAIVLGLSPRSVREYLLGFIKGLDDDGFVAFVQLLSERVLTKKKSRNVPNRGVFKAVGGIKTRAHVSHVARSLRDKLKGKTPFQILAQDGRWLAIKTKDPPWTPCVMLEFLQILREYDPTNTTSKSRAAAMDAWNELEAYFNADFYAALITLLKGAFTQGEAGTVPTKAMGSEGDHTSAAMERVEREVGHGKKKEAAHGGKKEDSRRRPQLSPRVLRTPSPPSVDPARSGDAAGAPEHFDPVRR
jgi:hypothetical protein